jgi:hypothetical protein
MVYFFSCYPLYVIAYGSVFRRECCEAPCWYIGNENRVDGVDAHEEPVFAVFLHQLPVHPHHGAGNDLDPFPRAEGVAGDFHVKVGLAEQLPQGLYLPVGYNGCLSAKIYIRYHIVYMQYLVVFKGRDMHKAITRYEGHIDPFFAVFPLTEFFLQGEKRLDFEPGKVGINFLLGPGTGVDYMPVFVVRSGVHCHFSKIAIINSGVVVY